MSDFNMPPGVSTRDTPGQDDEYEGDHQASAVLTLRDYFAAKALISLITLYEPASFHGTIPALADSAYQYADAMLESRKQ